jgi:type VI secretion system secreted protein Hcp
MAHEIYLKLYVETVPKENFIIGEAQEQDHKDWIVIDNFSCSVTAASSDNDDFYSGASEHAPIDITKHIDRSSPKLALAACMRTRFAKATIHICQSTATGSHNTIVLECILRGVTCLSYSLSGEDNSTDTIALKYDVIEWHYTYVDPFTLTVRGKVISRWDTKSNKGG